MAEVLAADVPAVVSNSTEKSSGLQQETATQQNGKPKTPSPEAERAAEKPETAHADDRQENESARVKEARRYNNRDRHRQDGDNDDRPYKKKSYPRNNKFDPSSLPESDDPALIRKQIEFYFSDSNLHGDKFLFTHIEGSTNNPVPIDVIHKFKRMQRFQPRSAIVSALKDSSTLNLVNDDNDIQRKIPLPEGLVGKPIHEIKEVHESKSMAQSIYAKGFGDEEASSQFDIEAFFAQYGTTNSVRLRRDGRASFKGSVFVEFDSEEQAKAFVALEPPPKYKDQELLIKSKKDYCDDKVEDIKAGKVRPNSQDRSGRKNHGNKDRDRNDDRDWRERRNEDSKDGFKDRRGNQRGGHFRGSDRGRRGNRGHGRGRGREGGDRRGRRGSPSYGNDKSQTEPADEQKGKTHGDSDETADATKGDLATGKATDSATDPVRSGEASKAAETVQPDQSGASDSLETSKKRQREADETTESLPPAKKVDDKTLE